MGKTLSGWIFIIITVLVSMFSSCAPPMNKEEIKTDIANTEKAFASMAAEKGIAEAFYYYAAENAVIKRQNDTLIKGKLNIRKYYESQNLKDAAVTWTPNFIDVSDCGTLAYTYGRYLWKIPDSSGKVNEYTGVFHTVWRKQKKGGWKYVWD
jgi:ketosteroid isomerase-like protein